MANVDWITIKNEYINTDISQRKIAEKHNVSLSTLTKRANREAWQQQRIDLRNKVATKVQQKTAEKIIEEEVNRIANILNTADTMQEKITESLSQLTTYVDLFGNSHESDLIDVNRLKKLVSALKDISDIVSSNDKTKDTGKLDKVLDEIGGVV